MTLDEFHAALGPDQIDGRQSAICETGEPYMHYRLSLDTYVNFVSDGQLLAALYGAIGPELAKPGKIYWRQRPTIERQRYVAISCRLVKTDCPVDEQIIGNDAADLAERKRSLVLHSAAR